MTDPCCRLCGYNSTDLVDIYSEQGIESEYVRKISRYLYLLVTPDDDLPKSICWMCSQQLDSFHRFHDKINEIQQRLLKDRYPSYVIEMHHNKYEEEMLEEEDEIEILEHSDEIALPIESLPPEQQLSESVEEDCSIQLIKSNTMDDSFLVFKSETVSTLVSSKQTMHDGSSFVTADHSAGDVEVFEIRKSSRKKRRTWKTKDNDDQTDSSQSEESDEEIQLEQMKISSPRRPTSHTKLEPELDSVERGTGESPESTNIKNRTSPRKSVTKKIKLTKDTKETSKAMREYDCEEQSEGDSEDEFPARDAENEEWPAATTMEKFPTEIVKDGLIMVKGKQLMAMISRFYHLQCDLCKEPPVRFKALSELFSHYKLTHKQEQGYVSCCQSKFSRYPAIIMHMARHLQPEAFKCDICGYIVTRPRFLAQHRQTHLPEDQKPYACEHCPKRFCWKRALHVHLNLHKAPEDRAVYICAICGKTYDTPGGLSAHKKNVHLKPRTSKISHVCEICANTFATSSGLKEHMTTIHQPREKGQLQCTECFKWLMNGRCLKVHMQLHSKEELVCDQCEYRTKKTSLLKRHKITHHQEERPFACDKCESSFKHKRALTVHMSTKHTEAKSGYKCNFCERSFKSSTNFYTHRKNRHPEELAALKEQQEAEKKLQRIKAGIEPDDIPSAQESTITTNLDGTRIITISSREYGVHESNRTMIVLDIADQIDETGKMHEAQEEDE